MPQICLQDGERLAPVRQFGDRYAVTSFGRVFSLNYKCLGAPAEITQHRSVVGYNRVGLCRDNKLRTVSVHRIVAEAFIIREDGEGDQVNHIDGVKTNNRVENLEWVTGKENTNHALKLHGNWAKRGEAHGLAQLTNAEVAEIKKILTTSLAGDTKVGRAYGVKRQLINRIRTGETWGHVRAAA